MGHADYVHTTTQLMNMWVLKKYSTQISHGWDGVDTVCKQVYRFHSKMINYLGEPKNPYLDYSLPILYREIWDNIVNK